MHKKSGKTLGEKGCRGEGKNQRLFLFWERETLLNKEKRVSKKEKRKSFTKPGVLRYNITIERQFPERYRDEKK